MVNYRGYLIHFRSEVLSWRFMAAPASPELPILSRGASRQFPSRDNALAEAKKHWGNHRCALKFSPKGRRHPSGADNKNRERGPT
jgi:hypothetical protein